MDRGSVDAGLSVAAPQGDSERSERSQDFALAPHPRGDNVGPGQGPLHAHRNAVGPGIDDARHGLDGFAPGPNKRTIERYVFGGLEGHEQGRKLGRGHKATVERQGQAIDLVVELPRKNGLPAADAGGQ